MKARKVISKKALKAKLAELGYNKAEIKSTVKQICKFDKDLKFAVYYWLYEDIVPGDSDPALIIEDKYTVESLCSDFGMSVPGALCLVQLYRDDKPAALDSISRLGARAPIDISDGELEKLYKMHGLSDDENEEPDDGDISVNGENSEEGNK